MRRTHNSFPFLLLPVLFYFFPSPHSLMSFSFFSILFLSFLSLLFFSSLPVVLRALTSALNFIFCCSSSSSTSQISEGRAKAHEKKKEEIGTQGATEENHAKKRRSEGDKRERKERRGEEGRDSKS